jgi:hypothetical protein
VLELVDAWVEVRLLSTFGDETSKPNLGQTLGVAIYELT